MYMLLGMIIPSKFNVDSVLKQSLGSIFCKEHDVNPILVILSSTSTGLESSSLHPTIENANMER